MRRIELTILIYGRYSFLKNAYRIAEEQRQFFRDFFDKLSVVAVKGRVLFVDVAAKTDARCPFSIEELAVIIGNVRASGS